MNKLCKIDFEKDFYLEIVPEDAMNLLKALL
jgi:hypothetical protein